MTHGHDSVMTIHKPVPAYTATYRQPLIQSATQAPTPTPVNQATIYPPENNFLEMPIHPQTFQVFSYQPFEVLIPCLQGYIVRRFTLVVHLGDRLFL
jgi:hypothetical protein